MKKILNNFTKRNLKLNIKRTIATCIGIILSTALICAVAGVLSSFQQTLIKHAKERDGDYHAMFFDVPKDEQKYILENRKIESSFMTQGVGYAKLEESKNEYKPYFYLMEFDKEAMHSLGLILKEGKMPETSNEIVISAHIEENGGVKHKIGDKLTLDIGKRMAEGYELGQSNPYNDPKDAELEGYLKEQLVSTGEVREFTIVGIIERPNSEIEGYSAPGYTVITKMEKARDNLNIAVKYKNIKETYNITKEIAKEPNNSIQGEYKYGFNINSELLRWSGVIRSEETMTMIYGLAGIVIGIIIVSSVFVIRNSFAISITEKMKQYGMLSSIGATKKQIKKNVLFEGMLLGVISIPIGILCGILATFILIKISTLLIGKSVFSYEVEFVFSMPIIVVIISIILGFVTIYLSSIFSARRASKISPIDAIRSNEDIKIKSKKIKSPKIIKKIFGIGGEIAYKNLKRNKSKYRTTVISLVVSTTVFISLSTFMNYVFDMSGIYYQEKSYNVSLSCPSAGDNKENSKEQYQFFQEIARENNLKEYSISRNIHLTTDLENKLTKEYKDTKQYNEQYAETEIEIYFVSLSKKQYESYIKEIGGKYEDYKDGIIYCEDTAIIYDENNTKIKPIELKVNDEINGKIVQTDKKVSLKIKKVTDKLPSMGGGTYTEFGTFIISDEMMDQIGDYNCYRMKVNAENPKEFCENVKQKADDAGKTIYTTNYQEEIEQNKKMVLLISIFLYGFITVISLIGVTNIFNTITTNMNLRSKEFAMLKSVGMTKKEFNKMIRLESIFYGVKSLIIGISLGLGISYWIYKVAIGAEATSGLKYVFPTIPVIISIVFIAVIVGIIMRYSLSKINKHNIIETIRNDNI